ncbi:MAG: two-component regulator propeller domain-containing protein, partial [Bacteroidota bacterium]
SYQFESYKKPDGLAADMVYCVGQDKDGFIWVGTANGLNRFDGSSFKKMYGYESEPIAGETLTNNIIKTLLFDHLGDLWVGTQGGGLNRIEYTTEAISSFQKNGPEGQKLTHDEVLCLEEDSEGNIWIGTENGISIWERSTGKIYQHLPKPTDPQALLKPGILNIKRGLGDDLWISSWNGVVHKAILPSDGEGLGAVRFERFPHKDLVQNSPADDAVWGLEIDHEGGVWAGTFGAGPMYRGPQDSTWHRFTRESEPNFGRIIFDVEEDPWGRIWVGSTVGIDIIESGANPRELTADQVFRLSLIPSVSRSLPSNQIRDIFIDRDSMIWVASEGGLSKYDPIISQFTSFLSTKGDSNPILTTSFARDETGLLWVGTDRQGIFLVDEESGNIEHLNPEINPSVPAKRISHMVYHQGYIWAAGSEGLFQIEPLSRQIKALALVNSQGNKLKIIRHIQVG